MKYPVVKAGQRNLAVRALQEGLHRAIFIYNRDNGTNIPHQNNRSGGYGTYTIKDVCRFKRLYLQPKGPIDCRYFGSDAWRAIEPFLGSYDRARIEAHNRFIIEAREAARKAADDAIKEVGLAASIAGAAVEFHNRCRTRYIYGQYRPMPSGLYVPEARTRIDCSTAVTLIYKEAGAPDPNGRDYDGYGYTGTLWDRGDKVSDAKAGDLIFYGNMGAAHGYAPSHVALCINPYQAFSFGSTPMRIVPLRYRRDVRGLKRYI